MQSGFVNIATGFVERKYMGKNERVCCLPEADNKPFLCPKNGYSFSL